MDLLACCPAPKCLSNISSACKIGLQHTINAVMPLALPLFLTVIPALSCWKHWQTSSSDCLQQHRMLPSIRPSIICDLTVEGAEGNRCLCLCSHPFHQGEPLLAVQVAALGCEVQVCSLHWLSCGAIATVKRNVFGCSYSLSHCREIESG